MEALETWLTSGGEKRSAILYFDEDNDNGLYRCRLFHSATEVGMGYGDTIDNAVERAITAAG